MQKPNVIDLFQQIAGNQYGYFSRLGTVADVMSREVPTVSCDDVFEQLIAQHQSLHRGRDFVDAIQSAAVIDPEDGEMIGVLNRSTALRCYPRNLNKLAEKDGERDIVKSTISSMATRPIPMVSSEADLLTTLDLLSKRHNDLLVVFDAESAVVGCVTPMDIIRVMSVYYQVYRQPQPLQRLRLIDLEELSLDDIFFRGALTARDVMSVPLTLPANEKVSTAIQELRQQDRTHLVAMDEHGLPVGIVGRDQIMLALKAPSHPGSIDTHNPFPRLEDLLGDAVDPALLETVAGLVGEVKMVESTFRFADILDLMIADDGPALLVEEDGQLQGIVTMDEVLRIFRTLLLIGKWNNNPG